MKKYLVFAIVFAVFSQMSFAADYSLECVQALRAKGFSLNANFMNACEKVDSKPGLKCVEVLIGRVNYITVRAISSAANCKNDHSVEAMTFLLNTYNFFSNGAIDAASKVKKEKQLKCFKKYITAYDGQITDSLLYSCL